MRCDAGALTQHPFAISWAAPTRACRRRCVFDHPLGDLFVVRVAGNIVHAPGLGSIEYAATHFGVAAPDGVGAPALRRRRRRPRGRPGPRHVGTLVDDIVPAVQEFKGKGGDALDQGVRANVRRVAAKLQSSEPILSALVKNAKLKVVWGKVEILA
jgi:carbonic anhydrase